MEVSPPMCFICQRFNESNFTCPAFPEGIPKEIWYAGFDHRKPFKGDHGMQFQIKKGVPVYDLIYYNVQK